MGNRLLEAQMDGVRLGWGRYLCMMLACHGQTTAPCCEAAPGLLVGAEGP